MQQLEPGRVSIKSSLTHSQIWSAERNFGWSGNLSTRLSSIFNNLTLSTILEIPSWPRSIYEDEQDRIAHIVCNVRLNACPMKLDNNNSEYEDEDTCSRNVVEGRPNVL